MCRINYRSASSYLYLNEWDSVSMDGNKLLAMSMASMSVTGMNLNTVPEKPKQWNGTNPAPVPKPPPAQTLTEIWNHLAKISPFSLWICSRALWGTDTADHWENSCKQLFMHSEDHKTAAFEGCCNWATCLAGRGGECLVQEDAVPSRQAHF